MLCLKYLLSMRATVGAGSEAVISVGMIGVSRHSVGRIPNSLTQ